MVSATPSQTPIKKGQRGCVWWNLPVNFVCGQMEPDRDHSKAIGLVQKGQRAWPSYLLSWQSPCTKRNLLDIGGNFFLVRGAGVR
jgi:hypothetical protein